MQGAEPRRRGRSALALAPQSPPPCPAPCRLAPPRCTWGGWLRSRVLTWALCACVSPPLHVTGASASQGRPQRAVGEGPCVLACPPWWPESAAGGPSDLQCLTFLKEPFRQNHSACGGQRTRREREAAGLLPSVTVPDIHSPGSVRQGTATRGHIPSAVTPVSGTLQASKCTRTYGLAHGTGH